MTVEECYRFLNGDYEDAKGRLINDRLIEKFMLKFPKDETMQQLLEALSEENYEMAFRCAHTLKGVAANLGFTALCVSASALTEALRCEKKAPSMELVQKTREDYNRTINALKAYQDEL